MTPENIYQVQIWKEHWERICSEGKSPAEALGRFLEEVQELQEVSGNINEDGKTTEGAKKIGGEVVDCVITALGILHQLGLPAEQMIYEKLEVMYKKYPPVVVADYMALGVPREEVMGKLKVVWNGREALNNGTG